MSTDSAARFRVHIHRLSPVATVQSVPSNLDHDQPLTGLAGETHAVLVERALATRLSAEEFDAAARALFARHRVRP